ncbi:MAG: cation diffusion facilitator family transporter, partial [Rhodospirillales bacterium]
DSVSLLSSLMDSLLDAGASIVNLIAVAHALQPADAEHRFGHGKAEPLAGLVQAAFITGSALFLVIEAGHRLFSPVPVAQTTIGIAVIVFSIAVTLALVLFQRYVVRKTGSVAIAADSVHYQSDLLMNAGVIAALVLSGNLGLAIADPVIAIAIAGYIVYGAYGIGKDSLDQLMDKEMPVEDRLRIREIAMGVKGVHGLHELRTRLSGRQAFIQLHLELPPDMSLKQAHGIAEAVMHKLERAFPGSEVLVHEDPEGVPERRRPV